MNEQLKRHEVVGVAIAKAYRTPWIVYEGCRMCKVFVELANDTLFQLENCCDDNWAGPTKFSEILAEWEIAEVNRDCENATVVDVATSEYWPSIGVVMSNGLILHMDSPHTYEFGPVLDVFNASHPTDGFWRFDWDRSDFESVWHNE